MSRVYCEYASTSDQTFNSAEEQLLHFLSRAGRPGWKWMSLRPRALTLHNAHKKQDRDSYYCTYYMHIHNTDYLTLWAVIQIDCFLVYMKNLYSYM